MTKPYLQIRTQIVETQGRKAHVHSDADLVFEGDIQHLYMMFAHHVNKLTEELERQLPAMPDQGAPPKTVAAFREAAFHLRGIADRMQKRAGKLVEVDSVRKGPME